MSSMNGCPAPGKRQSSIPRRANAVRRTPTTTGAREELLRRKNDSPKALCVTSREGSRPGGDGTTTTARQPLRRFSFTSEDNERLTAVGRTDTNNTTTSPPRSLEDATSAEAHRIVAIFREGAFELREAHNKRAWSGIDGDFGALELMIRSCPGIALRSIHQGLTIVRRLFFRLAADSDGKSSHEGTFQELRKFLESPLCGDMRPAAIDAVLILARRVEEHFRFARDRWRNRPGGTSSSWTSTMACSRTAAGASLSVSSGRPAETFNEMGFTPSVDEEERGRRSRRGSISRAACMVKDTIKGRLRRLSRTRGC